MVCDDYSGGGSYEKTHFFILDIVFAGTILHLQ